MRDRVRRRQTEPPLAAAPPQALIRRSTRSGQLEVGSVDDPAERAADGFASGITTALGLGSVSTHQAGARSVPSAGGGPLAASTARVLRSAGSGRPLEPSVSQRVQPLVDFDLASMRVHTGSAADTVARQIDAKAFTVGSDVYFRDGAYSTGTSEGMHTLAHEIGHVAQGSPRVHRFLDYVGKAREGDITLGDGADALAGWEDVANQIQATVKLAPMSVAERGSALTSDSGVGSFGDLDAVKRSMGAPAALGQVLKIGSGLKTTVKGAGNLIEADKGRYAGGKGSSILGNAGAQQLEAGTTDFLSGGTDLGTNITMNMVLKNVPGLDAVSSFKDAALNTKGAIEDTTAAAKLQGQKRKLKHELDQQMPMDLRLTRFKSFMSGNSKPGEMARFSEVCGEYVTEMKLTAPARDYFTTADKSDAHKEAFLRWLVAKGKGGYEDFGKGTEVRTAFETNAKNYADTHSDFKGVRDLSKVASFAHRRKAEMATFKSVDAAGNALDAAGTFTAAADMGATKATGKGIKAVSSSVKGVKTLVKKARRVHKLRNAKNAMGYGGKEDRSAGWGAKEFFFGDVARSQERALGAAEEAVRLRKQRQQHDSSVKPLYEAWRTTRTTIPAAQRAKDAHTAKVQEVDSDQERWYAQLAKAKPGAKGYADVEKQYDKTEAKLRALEAARPAIDNALQDAIAAEPVALAALQRAASAAAIALDPATNAPILERASGKAVTGNLDMTALSKQLKTQLDRRFENLLDALASSTTQARAIKVAMVICNTNLAGALRKLEPADLKHLGTLHAASKGKPGQLGTPDPTYVKLRDALHSSFQQQLSGIGG